MPDQSAPSPAPAQRSKVDSFRSPKVPLDDLRVPMVVWLKLKAESGTAISTRINVVASRVLEDWEAGRLVAASTFAGAVDDATAVIQGHESTIAQLREDASESRHRVESLESQLAAAQSAPAPSDPTPEPAPSPTSSPKRGGKTKRR